jgi:sigma-B regulation protein RsbQ
MTSSHFSALHAQIVGAGDKLLVFAHGFGCDRHIWRDVAPALQAHCRTLVYDHAGCGQSVAAWDPVRHAELQGHADDLLALLDEAGTDRVVAVGHSVGSIIVLLAALARPERFTRLVMLAPSPRFLNDPPDYVGGFEQSDIDELFQLMESNHFGWAQFLAPLAIGPANPVALTREFERALCSLEPTIARHFARLAFQVDVRDRLPGVQVPALIVQCSDDSLAPAVVGRWMHRHMPGSELVELQVNGHCPHVSHPDLVVDLLRGVTRG